MPSLSAHLCWCSVPAITSLIAVNLVCGFTGLVVCAVLEVFDEIEELLWKSSTLDIRFRQDAPHAVKSVYRIPKAQFIRSRSMRSSSSASKRDFSSLVWFDTRDANAVGFFGSAMPFAMSVGVDRSRDRRTHLTWRRFGHRFDVLRRSQAAYLSAARMISLSSL